MKKICNGCASLVCGTWPKNDAYAKCVNPKAGSRQGRVIHHQWTGLPVGEVIRPAWCPEPERGRLVTLGNGDKILKGI